MGDYSEYVGRELRQAIGIVNKIIVTRRYPRNDALAFLLVEGPTDEKLYKSFIDNSRCQIIIAYSKANTVEALSILDKDNFPGVLALVDADFDVLEETSPATPNLLFTDSHDLETMIMSSPALDKVLAEFGSQDKIARFEHNAKKRLLDVLIECGIPIGYLRWISLQHNLSLTFEGLDFEKFVNKEKLTIDVSKLIKTVKDKSQKPGISERELQSQMKLLANNLHDPWYVCCGHDLVCILSLGLTKTIGTHNTRLVEPEIVEKLLRLAYERSYFNKTELYLSIQQWEQANVPFVILSTE